MLRIRLTRKGAKKDPHFRVVVAEKRGPRDGRFVDALGYYNPALKPTRLHLDLDRVDYWIRSGAQPTETVRSLIRRAREASQVSETVAQAEPTRKDENQVTTTQDQAAEISAASEVSPDSESEASSEIGKEPTAQLEHEA